MIWSYFPSILIKETCQIIMISTGYYMNIFCPAVVGTIIVEGFVRRKWMASTCINQWPFILVYIWLIHSVFIPVTHWSKLCTPLSHDTSVPLQTLGDYAAVCPLLLATFYSWISVWPNRKLVCTAIIDCTLVQFVDSINTSTAKYCEDGSP